MGTAVRIFVAVAFVVVFAASIVLELLPGLVTVGMVLVIGAVELYR